MPPPFTLNAIDIAIIVGSLGLVLFCGWWAGRGQSKDSAKGYFVAAGKLPWYIIGTAFVSTSVSSEQIVGTIGQAGLTGMSLANSEWWSLPPYIFLVGIFIPLYLSNKITTVPEILTRRYGPICGNIYSWVMLVGYVVVFLVPVLYSGSLMFAELMPGFFGHFLSPEHNTPELRLNIVLWFTIILVAAYTVKGGLMSVMWTDALQCVMLLGGGLVLYFVALKHIPGGWSAMMAAAPERFHLHKPPSDPVAPFLGLCLGTAGVFMFYQATNQVIIQRVLGARTRWDGVMGITFAGFINLARPLVTCFLGFIVYHWTVKMGNGPAFTDETKDLTFSYALKTFSPDWGLRGIVLAGFLAAVMSTISALANSTATLFSLDVYHKLINKQATDRQLVRAGQIASVCALFIAGTLAPHVKEMGGIFKYFQSGVTYLSTPFITVIIVGIFWKRANYAAGIFGIVGGMVIQATVILVMQRVLKIDIYWVYYQSIAQVIIISGMIAVALVTAPPAVEQWSPFLWRPALLRQLNTSESGQTYPLHKNVFLWFGLFAAIWIYLYWRYW